MGPFVTVNPFNTNEWWECSGNTRRLLSGSQKYFISLVGGPTPIPADWFLSYPVATG